MYIEDTQRLVTGHIGKLKVVFGGEEYKTGLLIHSSLMILVAFRGCTTSQMLRLAYF
jgi:hypothetical protein